MKKLLEASMEYSVNNHPPMGLFTFIPSVDGDILPDRQSVVYKAGKFAKGVSSCSFSALKQEYRSGVRRF